MKKELIRIGTKDFENEFVFDLIFDGNHEFVYTPDYWPWEVTVNGTWTGALAHLMNGHCIGNRVSLGFILKSVFLNT